MRDTSRIRLSKVQICLLVILGTVLLALALIPVLTWNRYDAEDLLGTDQFGKVVAFYEGEGYMVLLTATPGGKKVRLLCFEEVIFGNYEKEPVFTGQYTDKSYQTRYLELGSRKNAGRDPGVFIEYGVSFEGTFVEIVYGDNMAYEYEYDREDGCFIGIRDFEADPYFRTPGRLYIQRVRVFDEDGEIIEEEGQINHEEGSL